jgi:hypothetical protein
MKSAGTMLSIAVSIAILLTGIAMQEMAIIPKLVLVEP